MDKNISEEWSGLHHDAMLLLQQEAELEEIVKLVGTTRCLRLTA